MAKKKLRTVDESRALMAWGKELRQAREQRGLVVKEAAKLHGVSQGTWWNWESGIHGPQGRHLEPMRTLWPELRPLGVGMRSLI